MQGTSAGCWPGGRAMPCSGLCDLPTRVGQHDHGIYEAVKKRWIACCSNKFMSCLQAMRRVVKFVRCQYVCNRYDKGFRALPMRVPPLRRDMLIAHR